MGIIVDFFDLCFDLWRVCFCGGLRGLFVFYGVVVLGMGFSVCLFAYVWLVWVFSLISEKDL